MVSVESLSNFLRIFPLWEPTHMISFENFSNFFIDFSSLGTPVPYDIRATGNDASGCNIYPVALLLQPSWETNISSIYTSSQHHRSFQSALAKFVMQ